MSELSNAPLLELSPEQMRTLGYRVVDMLADHISGLAGQTVGRRGDPALLRPLFEGTPAPEQPCDPAQVLHRVEHEILANTLHVDHPRFFGFVPGPGNFVSAMADALVSGFNVFNGTWMAGSGPASVELAVVDWFRQWCGLPDQAGGIFVSGGSMANLTALAVARHLKLGDDVASGVVYFSDQTHSSIQRALRVLGLRTTQMRRLPSNAEFRLDPAATKAAVLQDRAAGLRPFCIIANAGTTNTGAVDDLSALSTLARRYDLWLHADGAYGAAATICERGRRELAGLDAVDSLSLDPHKWLFQSFECGCVLLRDASHLRAFYQILPDYLRDVHRGLEEVNPCDYGIQLTRSFRALKVWMSMHVFGVEQFRRAVERGFELAEYAGAQLAAMPDWEILSPPQIGILAFQYRHGVPASALVEAMLQDGFALLTSTTLRDASALRLCTINPRTTEADIDATLARLDRFAFQLRPKSI